MSTLQIKPRNDTDQLKIQTSGGNTAFFVHGSGATLKNSIIENTNTFPTGHVLQVKNSYVNAVSNGFNVASEPNTTTGGQYYVAPSTPLSVNITPKASGNKFIIMCNLTYGSGNVTAMFVIKRTAPTVAYSNGVGDTSGDARKASFIGYHGNNSDWKMGASIHWLDTSVSTAQHTYSLFGGHNGTGTSVYLGGSHASYVGGSTLTVMEIAG